MSEEYLRPVIESDINFLFDLANEEECRNNSFQSNPILFSSHKEWFYKKFNSDTSKIYIYMSQTGEPIGQARIDIDRNIAIISYSIVKEKRGKGYGGKIINLLEKEALKSYQIEYLYARVKSNNKASNHIFKGFAYKEDVKDDFIEYRKKLREFN